MAAETEHNLSKLDCKAHLWPFPFNSSGCSDNFNSSCVHNLSSLQMQITDQRQKTAASNIKEIGHVFTVQVSVTGLHCTDVNLFTLAQFKPIDLQEKRYR